MILSSSVFSSSNVHVGSVRSRMRGWVERRFCVGRRCFRSLQLEVLSVPFVKALYFSNGVCSKDVTMAVSSMMKKGAVSPHLKVNIPDL